MESSEATRFSLKDIRHIELLGNYTVRFNVYLEIASGSAAAQQASKFLGFARLPRELQDIILEHCDYATLFHLMHVSRSTRPRAQALFWSSPNVWYHIDAAYILVDDPPCYSFNSGMCKVFASRIQQIELDRLELFARFPMSAKQPHDATEPIKPEYIADIESEAHKFWHKMRHNFAAMRRIVVNDGAMKRLGKINDDSGQAQEFERRDFTTAYSIFARTAPPNIQVLLLKCSQYHDMTNLRIPLQHLCARDRDLYELCDEATWTLIQSHWTRHRVKPPNKAIHGVLGTIKGHWRRLYSIREQADALWLLRIEAYEHHFFQFGKETSFTCPHPECEQIFDSSGKYRAHAIQNELHTGKSANLPVKDADFPSLLPICVEQQFEREELAYLRAFEQAKQDREVFFSSWGPQGTDKHEALHAELLKQLGYDTEGPPELYTLVRQGPICYRVIPETRSLVMRVHAMLVRLGLREKEEVVYEEADPEGDYDMSD